MSVYPFRNSRPFALGSPASNTPSTASPGTPRADQNWQSVHWQIDCLARLNPAAAPLLEKLLADLISDYER